MTILVFFVQLMSGAMLLLFSVRFMRIGIERLWSAQIRTGLNEHSSALGNLFKGAGLGFAMQGSAVVMLMGAGLAGTGAIPVVSAAVVAFGADMGSALAVQFLQLPVSAIGPLAILVGATIYLRAQQSRLRNYGRVLLGLGLVFLSLSIIRTSVAPIGALEGTTPVADYLNRDPVTAALMGIALTLLMHSSVAALLTAVAFVDHAGIMPIPALAFVLGCNFGSALLPVWLLRSENGKSRSVALAVAALRCGAALVFFLALTGVADLIGAIDLPNTGTSMLAGHITFNLVLLLLTPLLPLVTKALTNRLSGDADQVPESLPAGMAEDMGLILPAMKRKLSNMLELSSSMLEEVESTTPDPGTMANLERRMNAGLIGMREIFASLPGSDDTELTDIQQVLDFAIRVERAGDALSGGLLTLRLEQAHGEFQFSKEGEAEIAQIVDALRQTIVLAHETAWTSNIATAERLVRHKQHVTDLEQSSRSRHLLRLRHGNLTSLSSSNQHLEMIAALKEINSKLAAIGYAVLERHGGLKKTRIKSSFRAVAT